MGPYLSIEISPILEWAATLLAWASENVWYVCIAIAAVIMLWTFGELVGSTVKDSMRDLFGRMRRRTNRPR